MNPSPLPALDARRSMLDPAASPALDARHSTLGPAASVIYSSRLSSRPPESLISEPNSLTVFSLNPCAAPSSRKRSAFSLIEVVLAIGVVAFALVGIFGLFSASLKTNKDSSVQQEGFEIPRLVISTMQGTNFLSAANQSNLMTTLYQNSGSTNYYVYVSSNSLVLTNSATSYRLTNGLLYYVQMAKTTNINSMTNVFPGTDWTNWPGLPVQVSVYHMPAPSISLQTLTNGNVPVMIFDMVIPR